MCPTCGHEWTVVYWLRRRLAAAAALSLDPSYRAFST